MLQCNKSSPRLEYCVSYQVKPVVVHSNTHDGLLHVKLCAPGRVSQAPVSTTAGLSRALLDGPASAVPQTVKRTMDEPSVMAAQQCDVTVTNVLFPGASAGTEGALWCVSPPNPGRRQIHPEMALT